MHFCCLNSLVCGTFLWQLKQIIWWPRKSQNNLWNLKFNPYLLCLKSFSGFSFSLWSNPQHLLWSAISITYLPQSLNFLCSPGHFHMVQSCWPSYRLVWPALFEAFTDTSLPASLTLFQLLQLPSEKPSLNPQPRSGSSLDSPSYLTEGDQNMLPPDGPLWHADYFELQTLEKQQRQKGLSALPLST